jgi:PBP1b-binding outer membrane lipoprotein LpoB
MKLVLSAAVLALLLAGCATHEPIEPNERLNTEYVTGSNLPRKSRPSEVTTYDKESVQRARDAAVQAPRPGLGNSGP